MALQARPETVRLGRILLLAAATVIVLMVAAVAVLPSVLDWNRYRGTLELLAGDALGRPVTIAGPVSLSILPEPMLTASRVRVDGGEDGTRILVAELRLRVALVPLLSGRVDASELTLRQPNLHLPWPPRLGLPFATPPWLAALSARIEDGAIEAGGLTLTHVNATLTAGRGSEALVLSGSAAMGSSLWQLSLRLGDPEQDGNAPIEANLGGAGAAVGIAARLVGVLQPDGRIRGHIVVEGPDLARLMEAPPLPFHADGTILTGAEAVRLTDLALRLGGASALGSGVLALAPGLRLNLALSAVDAVPLDPWLTVLRTGGESRLPIGLTLDASRATLARGLLQDVRLAAVFAPEGARIGAFQAVLPGGARFAAEGQLTPAQGPASGNAQSGNTAQSHGGGWQFMGTAHLLAPSLDTTAHWLDAAAPGVVPRLAPRLLRAANLSARVTIDSSRIALEGIAGTFDQSHVGGGLTLGLGGTPAISAGLTLDRLDLGPWLTWWRDEAQPLAAVPHLFAGMAVELRLSAGQATLGETTLSNLSLDAAAEGGEVILRRLDTAIDGMHAIASGALGTRGVVTAGQLALTAPGTEAVAALLPMPFETALKHWRAPISLNATAAGAPNALHLSIDATLGDLRVTADPVVNLQSGDWQGPVTLRHPGAAELIAATGLPDPTPWLGPGSFSLIGQVTGSTQAWTIENFRLIAGSLAANGSLHLVIEPNGPAISGTIRASALPVPVPAPNGRQLLPLALLTGWRGNVRFAAGKVLGGLRPLLGNAEGRVSAGDGALSLEVTGNPPGGGTLTAVLGVDAKAEVPRFRLGAAFGDVRLAGGVFHMPLDLSSGTISGKLGFTGEGYGPAALLATLSGRAELTGEDGTVTGFNLASVRAVMAGHGVDAGPAFGKALGGGTSTFRRIAVEAKGAAGRFTLDKAVLSGDDGTIRASGNVDLPDGTEDLRLALASLPAGSPEIILRLAGSISAPQRLIEMTDALDWLAKKNRGKAGH